MDLNRNGVGEKQDAKNTSRLEEKSFRTALPQILATLAKNLILIGYGMTLGFPTIVIPALSESAANATLHLTKEEISWFGSINLITVPLGCLVSGLVTQPFGRKRSMQVLNIPFLITWIMFYYSESVAMLYASLALTGLAGGLLEAPVLTYVAEITQPHLRGFLSASSSLAVIVGIFTQFLMGTFVNWRTLALINSAAPVIAFFALFFIPESPHWLIGHNRTEDAEKALCWLRGWVSPELIQEELEEVKIAILHLNAATGQSNGKISCMESFKIGLKNFSRRTFIRPFVLVMACFFLSNNTGIPPLGTYAVGIFAALGTPIDKYYATVMLGVAQMLGSGLCAVMIHYTGKRPLVIGSTLVQSTLFCCVGFYAYFYAGVSNLDGGAAIKATFEGKANPLSWVPLVGLVGGALASFMGARLLPWVIIGEIFPPEIRALASGFGGSTFYVFAFAANKGFFTLVDTITLPGVYWFYAGIALSAAAVYYFFLPETEGWSLLEVQEHFEGKRNLIKAGKKPVGSKDLRGVENVGMSMQDVS